MREGSTAELFDLGKDPSEVNFERDELNEGKSQSLFATFLESKNAYDVDQITEQLKIQSEKNIRTGCFCPDGEQFAFCDRGTSLSCYSLESVLEDLRPTTGQSSQKLPEMIFSTDDHHAGNIYCMDWSPDQQVIATGSNDKTIKAIVNPSLLEEQGILETEFAGHSNKVRTLGFTKGQTLKLVSGGDVEGEIKVWDPSNSKQESELQGHTKGVIMLKTYGENQFVSIGKDKSVKMWDLRCS